MRSNYSYDIPVKISLRKTINTVRGCILSRKIVDISQEDLRHSIKNLKVVDTGTAVVTFD